MNNCLKSHLLNCFVNDKILPFPKVLKMPKMPTNDPKCNTINLYCSCRLPDVIDNLIRCSNQKCKIKWYHNQCVQLGVDDNFLCKMCSL